MSEELKNLVASNKRLLQHLDAQIDYLRLKLEVDRSDKHGRMPFFYSAVGEDGENGILLGPAPNREFVGRISIEEDAPFVWTHVLAAQRFTSPVSTVGDRGFMSIWNGAGGAPAKNPLNVDLGFIEEGSGRILYQSERQNPVSGPDDTGLLVSGAVFDSTGMHPAGLGGFAASVVTQWAGGKGPNFAKELPAEVVLPANDVVSIRAKPQAIDTGGADSASRSPRLYVTLVGYKVLA